MRYPAETAARLALDLLQGVTPLSSDVLEIANYAYWAKQHIADFELGPEGIAQ